MSPAFLSFSPGAESALITGTVLSPFGVVLEFLFEGLEALDARLDVTVVRVPFAGLTVREPRVGLASREARTDRDDTGRATL